jgi:1-aminocyclopropane-1-carboxylate deaminase
VAAAGKKVGIPTIGFVRGEELEKKERNPTLAFCEAEGMSLYFLNREAYRKKAAAPMVQEIVMEKQYVLLAEGGTNSLAIKGCEEILLPDDKGFDCVAVAVGTGGTFMGLLNTIIKNKQWRWGKNILIIHTGGIQGIEGFNIRQKQKGKPCIIH